MRAIIHGNGGTDLDVITAGAGDVLAPKVIVDRDGEPVAGTLALSGNASPADVRSGRTYYGTDARTRMTGTMAEKGAAAYTPGSYNQVIGAGQYLAGAQTIWGDGNLAAQYIKKGVTIFGVTGTFEGWVPTPQDLYYNGVNIAGFTTEFPIGMGAMFQNTQILVVQNFGSWYLLKFQKDYDVRSYSRLIFEGSFASATPGGIVTLRLIRGPQGSEICRATANAGAPRIVMDITQLTSLEKGYVIEETGLNKGDYITRIRLE